MAELKQIQGMSVSKLNKRLNKDSPYSENSLRTLCRYQNGEKHYTKLLFIRKNRSRVHKGNKDIRSPSMAQLYVIIHESFWGRNNPLPRASLRYSYLSLDPPQPKFTDEINQIEKKIANTLLNAPNHGFDVSNQNVQLKLHF